MVKATLSDKSTQDISSKLVWKSSNTKIASVKNGVVKALSKGTAKLTASYMKMNVTVDVTVK